MDGTNPTSHSEITEPQSLASPVIPKHPQQIGVFSDQVVQMRLEDIKGEHTAVREFDRILKLPYFSAPRQECLPKDIVLNLMERTPLLTCQEKGLVVCIGNIRVYRMALIILDPSELVPTIEHLGPLNRERLRQSLLIETFLLPAVLGRSASELKALSAAWERAAGAKMLKFWPCENFAALYRGDAVQSEKKKRVPRLG